MLNLRTPRERTLRVRRFGRSARSIAAVITTSLIAPAALVSVATTVGTTIAAAPAGALAVRTFVVSGDDPSRTGAGSGAWGFHGVDYSQLRSIITSSANFGPAGIVKTASFSIGTPVLSASDASLAGVDVFFSGAIQSGYTADEDQALIRFVNRGGMLILNANSQEWNTAGAYGFTAKDPQAIYEPGSHAGGGASGSGVETNAYAAPQPSQATGSHPILQGPFGTVTTFQNWHTVTAFTVVPAGAQTLATLTYACGGGIPFCSGPAAPPPPPTSTTATTTTLVPPPAPEHAYNQSFAGQSTLAVIPPSVVGGVRRGAVIVTSDVDTYSNHATPDDPSTPLVDESEIYANPMLTGNEILAKNTFAYIANQLTDGYVSLASPTRIMSTRDGVGVTQAKVTAGGTRTLQVTGTAGIPSSATAVALNVTVTNATLASFVSVFPTGSVASGTTPNTSNLNFSANQTIPNMVIVQLPASGQLTFFNESGSVDILADAVGYYTQGGGDRFNAVTPDRVLDTRGGAPFAAKVPRQVQVTGAGLGTVPAGATAVVLNVTSVNNTTGGFLTVYPGDAGSPPNASNLNFVPGLVIPNLVISKLSPTGTINIYNDAGTTDVVVDVLGYFVATSGGGSFGPLTPIRVLDTRSGLGGTTGPVGADGTITLTVRGVGGVPASGVRTVILNVTAAAPTSDSFITVWPEGTRPNASNLNTTAGKNIPNLVVAAIGADGKVRLFNKNGSVHLIADVMGYYS